MYKRRGFYSYVNIRYYIRAKQFRSFISYERKPITPKVAPNMYCRARQKTLKVRARVHKTPVE